MIERGEVHQIDLAMVLHSRRRAATATDRPLLADRDHHDQPARLRIVMAKHVDIGPADQQLAAAIFEWIEVW